MGAQTWPLTAWLLANSPNLFLGHNVSTKWTKGGWRIHANQTVAGWRIQHLSPFTRNLAEHEAKIDVKLSEFQKRGDPRKLLYLVMSLLVLLVVLLASTYVLASSKQLRRAT